jgi:hypothetical protein
MKVIKQSEHELIVGGVYIHKVEVNSNKKRLCILVNNEKKLMCVETFEVLTSKYRHDNYEFLGIADTIVIN